MKHFSPPQRCTPIAAPGSLLKVRRREQDRPAGRRDTPIDPSHLQCIRQLPCLKCGLEPCGEAAHHRANAPGKRQALGKRPDDRFALPLCRSCHLLDPDAQHKIGEDAFWGALGIDPLLVAHRLFEATGDVVRMRAVVLTAIAERAT